MVNRHVIGSISVVFAADIFGEIVERVGCQVGVTLKHHVLEEMGKTAPARRIVFRADVIPHLDSDDRRGVIFYTVDLKAVRKGRVFEDHRRHGHRFSRG